MNNIVVNDRFAQLKARMRAEQAEKSSKINALTEQAKHTLRVPGNSAQVVKNRGNNLSLLLKSLTVTQEELASTLEMNQSEVSSYVNSNTATRKEISPNLARKIEYAYGLPAGWLDRPNADFFLSDSEMALIEEIRKSPSSESSDPAATLVKFVKNIREVASNG